MSHAARILFLLFLLAGLAALVAPRRLLRNGWDKITAVVRPARNATILIWLVALIPMLHLTYLVRHYSVEVPTLDDWEMTPLIVHAQTGQLKFSELFAQQEEARTVLPKLIFILSATDGRWDVRDQMMLSVFCCWLTVVGIYVLLRRAGLGFGEMAVCFWLVVITIFTPAIFELWIFASGFPSFLPALFLVAGLVAVGSNVPTGWKFAVCGVLAIASSFSLPHGLLLWGLTFPVLLVIRPLLHWRSWLLGWVVLGGICVAPYFWGYQKPEHLPAFAPPTPMAAYLRFILEFLGGGLAYARNDRPGLSAGVFGVAQCVLFFAALLYIARRFRDRVFIAKCAPWLALALYSFGSAFLAALGRVGYGANYALASRYVAFSLYLTVALIALGAVLVREMLGRGLPHRGRGWIYGICLLFLLGYAAPNKVSASNTTFFLRALSAKDRLARAAVLFSPIIDTSDVIRKTAYPSDSGLVIKAADALDRLKLLHPPLVRSDRLEAIPHETADGYHAEGACEMINRAEAPLVQARGWAVLTAKGRPPDGVAVAYQKVPDQEWTICAISDLFGMRPEMVRRFGSLDQLWSGWTATFPQGAFPVDAKLSFWALDADGPKLYRLKDDTVAITR